MISKSDSKNAKGILCLMVLFHHVVLYSEILKGSTIYKVFSLWGFLAVTIFFYFSGYGLGLSENTDSDKNCTVLFLKTRVLTLYLKYLLIAFLYLILYVVLKRKIDLTIIFRTLGIGKTIVFGGWYIQVTFFLYLIWCLFNTLFTDRDKSLLWIIICVIGYCFACYFIKVDYFWYISLIGFIVGIENGGSKGVVNRRNPLPGMFFFNVLLFFVTLLLYTQVEYHTIQIILGIISCYLFIPVFFKAFRFINNNTIIKYISRWLGEKSLAIYLSQGLMILPFQYLSMSHETAFLYYSICLIGTIAISIPLSYIFNRIGSSLRKTIEDQE